MMSVANYITIGSSPICHVVGNTITKVAIFDRIIAKVCCSISLSLVFTTLSYSLLHSFLNHSYVSIHGEDH